MQPGINTFGASLRSQFFAHSGLLPDGSDWQLLHKHLETVAELAKIRAMTACPGSVPLAEAAWMAGLLHDLGKYRPEFQQMLRGVAVQREKTFHKQAGAAKAAEGRHVPVAFSIAGHHGGLPDKAHLQSLIKGDAGQGVAKAIWPVAITDCPLLTRLSVHSPAITDSLEGDLFTRLVFSCLVDADWTDTGNHDRRIKHLPAEPAPPSLDAPGWLERLLQAIREKAAQCKDQKIAALRAEILQACLNAAEQQPGLFSLTVPTGGGKTFSGLAFALKHAAKHGLRRIIYVAPYLSILDQNAAVIRKALGVAKDAAEVFEHHSLAPPPGDPDTELTHREAAARRAENWDSPLVITTSVQFFESLFSNKPGRCRKLHNIARSVVVLDECQTLPPDLVAPTCGMLNQVAVQLGATLVLCTATQPAFDHPDMPEPLVGVREIIPKECDVFRRLRRVEVTWPNQNEILDWPDIAGQMLKSSAALCIVNTRKAARDLFQVLSPEAAGNVFHLSTSMCPAHRLAVLDTVKTRLKKKEPCYLVSTQLIEAGVDVDFPFVFRELAPLEAIIQSAGRCNREGLLNRADGSPGGRVLVFRSVEGALPKDRWYKAGRSVVETAFLNNGRLPCIDDPADVRDYFHRLYRTGDLDKENIQGLRRSSQFETVAEKYRLIDDDGIPVVIATWDEKKTEVEELLDQVRLRPVEALSASWPRSRSTCVSMR